MSDHAAPPPTGPNGILIIDKPAGWTSHDVVAKVRRILGTKKVGHAGTLDPMATGVLIILVGTATKKSDLLLSQDKAYTAAVTFGVQTDSADADGLVTIEQDASHVTAAAITTACHALTGTREQTVPAHSAVKVNGQKLYHLAHRGQKVPDRPTRVITIHDLTCDSLDTATPHHPVAHIHVTCSKGTYIRVLAEELATQLGTVAHLTALRRLASGPYGIDQAVTLEMLGDATDPANCLHDVSAL